MSNLNLHNARIAAEREQRRGPFAAPPEPPTTNIFHFDRAPTRGGKHCVTFTVLYPFWTTLDGDAIRFEPPTEERIVKYIGRPAGAGTYFEAIRADGTPCPDLDVDLRQYQKDRRERELAVIRAEVERNMAEAMYPQLYCAAVASGAADPLHAAVLATRIWLRRNHAETVDDLAKKFLTDSETG